MILLNKSEYNKILLPLKEVVINHLFAEAVLLGHANGKVYVDQAMNPTSFYVCHPYGMSLLFGDTRNEKFNIWLLEHALNNLKTRNSYEWLQAFPETWNHIIQTHWKEHLIKQEDNYNLIDEHRIEVNTRVNFKFNKTTYLQFKDKHPLENGSVIRTTDKIFENMEGSVIPRRFWENSVDFLNRAIAFSVLEGDKVAATAFSAFLIGNQLEIGIETSDGFRGKGYALAACSALIDYCLEFNYEPVWGCKLENTASYLLSQKLGFEPIIYWPFYRLNC